MVDLRLVDTLPCKEGLYCPTVASFQEELRVLWPEGAVASHQQAWPRLAGERSNGYRVDSLGWVDMGEKEEAVFVSSAPYQLKCLGRFPT